MATPNPSSADPPPSHRPGSPTTPTATPSPTPQDGRLLKKMRLLRDQYAHQFQPGSALFWASQVLAGTDGQNPADVIAFSQCLYQDGQFQRAAFALTSRGLDRSNLRACYLTAKCYFRAQDAEEAKLCLDLGQALILNARHQLNPSNSSNELRQTLSSIYLLKGQILASLDNRILAAEAFKEALSLDVYCSEAFQAVIQHQIFSAEEERELLKAMPFSEQCAHPDEEEFVSFLYRIQLKKYDQPADLVIPDKFKSLRTNTEIQVHQAERHFYNCDYNQCFKITSSLMSVDPYNGNCLPIHVSCLIELEKSNDLFHLAHKLVDLFPEWAGAWFAVGTYYYLVGKHEFARRYLSKATHLDRVYGPAWLAYGHSFALESEHDQAMAAYFKACQLMKGCHLPLLYIGVEYGLTNNAKLAERFFTQALDIAPQDPFVLHELGVTAFQNNNFAEAEKYFLQALAQVKQVNGSIMSSKWEPLLNNLGHCARKLGKFDDALNFHQLALVLQPMSASTFSAIGFVHSLKGDLLEAEEAFHKALGIRRDDSFSTSMLNNVIEQMISDEPTFSGVPEEIPKFDPISGGSTTLLGDRNSQSGDLSTTNATTPGNNTGSFDVDMADASLNSD